MVSFLRRQQSNLDQLLLDHRQFHWLQRLVDETSDKTYLNDHHLQTPFRVILSIETLLSHVDPKNSVLPLLKAWNRFFRTYPCQRDSDVLTVPEILALVFAAWTNMEPASTDYFRGLLYWRTNVEEAHGKADLRNATESTSRAKRKREEVMDWVESVCTKEWIESVDEIRRGVGRSRKEATPDGGGTRLLNRIDSLSFEDRPIKKRRGR
jgi:hypothetical protein